jgi:hypothetical protein
MKKLALNELLVCFGIIVLKLANANSTSHVNSNNSLVRAFFINNTTTTTNTTTNTNSSEYNTNSYKNGVSSAFESFLLGLSLYVDLAMAVGVGMFLMAFGYILSKCVNRSVDVKVQNDQFLPLPSKVRPTQVTPKPQQNSSELPNVSN